MPNGLEKILDYIVAALLMFFIPVCIFSVMKDRVVQVNVEKATTEFSETVTTQGYITRNMYEKYLRDLGNTGKLYDVELVHELYAFEPEYKLRSAFEVIGEDESHWEGVNEHYASEVITEVPVITDPIDNSGLTMNTETNESILAAAVSAPSTGHVHTDACYGGHRHTALYGTLDLTNVQVYAQYFYSEYDGHTYYKVYCTGCGRQLYEIRYRSGWTITGYTRTFSYDSAGNQTFVQRDFNIDYTLHSANQNAFIQKLNSLSGYFISKGATSANHNTTSAFYWDYGSYPAWDAVGNEISVPFTGCSYEEGHPNPAACVPIGYKGKVHLQVNSLYDSEFLSRTLQIYIYCSKCNRQIASIEIKYTNMGSCSNYNAGTYTNFYDYNSDGSICQKYYNAGTSWIGSYNDTNALEEWAWNDSCIIAYSDLWNRVSGLPKTVSTEISFTTPDIDWPLTTIPVRSFTSENIPVQWIPFRGCVYCGTYGENYSCGLTQEVTCDRQIVELTPTHPIQAVYTGENLITTATATYRDGSTKVVACTTDFLTNATTNNTPVSLSYTDTLGNALTTTITVTVVPKTKTCANGHIYNLNNDGSDPGCPYCKGYLRSLSVAVPSSGSMTMLRSSTGSLEEEGVGLLATYLDGHSEYVYTGYTDNLDPIYVGSQTVTIGYKGLSTTLEVTVLRNRKQCDVCGLFYDLYIDDTDPGCPYCKAKVPIFTGDVMKYCAATYDDEVITELYEGTGSYYFRQGDKFKIKIKSKNESKGIIGRLFNLTIRVQTTDSVKEEVYHN